MKFCLDEALNSRLKPASVFDAQHPMFSYDHAEPQTSTREFLKGGDRFFVLGMGGSLLPLQAWVSALQLEEKFVFIESIDPDYLKAKLQIQESDRICVVSKTGKTFEVQVMLQDLLQKAPQAKVMVATDPKDSVLISWAESRSYPLEVIPSELGGRFTNFSPLHQALLEECGIDYKALQSAACQRINELQKDASDLERLFALSFADQRDLVIWTYGERLSAFANWFQQIHAESLGKRNEFGFRVGSLPTILKGPRDQHSVLQFLMDGPQRYSLLFLEDEGLKSRGAEAKNIEGSHLDFKSKTSGELMSLMAESNFKTFLERTESPDTYQPLARWQINTSQAVEIAEQIAFAQAYVEYSGKRLGIDAFDQPGVERGKQIAQALLS